MNTKKIKEAYKIYNSTFRYIQKIKALLIILNSDDAEYPSNFLLTIAKRDLKQASQKISKCYEILVRMYRK